MKEEMGGGLASQGSEKRQGKIFEKKMDSLVGKIRADVSNPTSPSLSEHREGHLQHQQAEDHDVQEETGASAEQSPEGSQDQERGQS